MPRRRRSDRRHPGVKPQPGDVVRGVDPQELLPEAPNAVEGDVGANTPGGAEPETVLDEVHSTAASEIPDQLVQERRVEGRRVEIGERPVDRVDLEAPGQVGRLAEQPWFHQLPSRPIPWASRSPGARQSAGAIRRPRRACDDAADEAAERDAAPHAEPPRQIANGPHHVSGTSSQLVITWYRRAPTIPAATPQTAQRKISPSPRRGSPSASR